MTESQRKSPLVRQLEGPPRLPDMRAIALTLPPELKLYIATFCTPSSLASLAQVHTSYQVQAERELYQNKAIYADSLVVDTIKNRPHKAGLVRSMTIELPLDNSSGFSPVMSLCDALCSMHSLVDLRIRMPGYQSTSWPALINKVLCSQNFKLRTLYCDQYLDIANIIVGQPELQLLGLYRLASFLCTPYDVLHLTLKFNSPKPTLFVLEPYKHSQNFNSLYVFPQPSANLLYPWEALTDSFDKDIAHVVQLDKYSIVAVRIYLGDLSHMAFFKEVVGRMLQSLPNINELTFFTQCSPQMPHSCPDLVSLLSSIPLPVDIVYLYWQNSGDISRADQMALGDEWAGRNLRAISFLEETTVFTFKLHPEG